MLINCTLSGWSNHHFAIFTLQTINLVSWLASSLMGSSRRVIFCTVTVVRKFMLHNEDEKRMALAHRHSFPIPPETQSQADIRIRHNGLLFASLRRVPDLKRIDTDCIFPSGEDDAPIPVLGQHVALLPRKRPSTLPLSCFRSPCLFSIYSPSRL